MSFVIVNRSTADKLAFRIWSGKILRIKNNHRGYITGVIYTDEFGKRLFQCELEDYGHYIVSEYQIEFI